MSQEPEDELPRPPDNKAFMDWLQTLPDPEQRYRVATSALEDYQEIVNQLSELRAGAVSDASEESSVSSVARRFGVSRQRAHQLLRQAKRHEPAPAEPERQENRQKGSKHDQE
jgi:DNA-directed RNA polymerase sigma subunit (sigma70/sigma32)